MDPTVMEDFSMTTTQVVLAVAALPLLWMGIIQMDRRAYGMPLWDGTARSLFAPVPTRVHPVVAKWAANEAKMSARASARASAGHGSPITPPSPSTTMMDMNSASSSDAALSSSSFFSHMSSALRVLSSWEHLWWIALVLLFFGLVGVLFFCFRDFVDDCGELLIHDFEPEETSVESADARSEYSEPDPRDQVIEALDNDIAEKDAEIARLRSELSSPREKREESLPPTKTIAPEPAQTHSATGELRSQIERVVLDSDGWREYNKAFPSGHETIETSSSGFLCGLFAVIATLKAMHSHITPPTIYDLLAALKLSAAQADATGFQMSNDNNFTVDQVASALIAWGKSQGRRFQLGYLVNGQKPALVGMNDEGKDEGPTTIVWIYNDGNNLLTSDWSLGHYSGMRRRVPPEGPGEAILRLVESQMDCKQREYSELRKSSLDRINELEFRLKVQSLEAMGISTSVARKCLKETYGSLEEAILRATGDTDVADNVAIHQNNSAASSSFSPSSTPNREPATAQGPHPLPAKPPQSTIGMPPTASSSKGKAGTSGSFQPITTPNSLPSRPPFSSDSTSSTPFTPIFGHKFPPFSPLSGVATSNVPRGRHNELFSKDFQARTNARSSMYRFGDKAHAATGASGTPSASTSASPSTASLPAMGKVDDNSSQGNATNRASPPPSSSLRRPTQNVNAEPSQSPSTKAEESDNGETCTASVHSSKANIDAAKTASDNKQPDANADTKAAERDEKHDEKSSAKVELKDEDKSRQRSETAKGGDTTDNDNNPDAVATKSDPTSTATSNSEQDAKGNKQSEIVKGGDITHTTDKSNAAGTNTANTTATPSTPPHRKPHNSTNAPFPDDDNSDNAATHTKTNTPKALNSTTTTTTNPSETPTPANKGKKRRNRRRKKRTGRKPDETVEEWNIRHERGDVDTLSD